MPAKRVPSPISDVAKQAFGGKLPPETLRLMAANYPANKRFMKPNNPNFEQDLWLECQKSQDPQSALALLNLMSAISERCMCAGWCMGTEFALWNFLHNQKTLESRTWGMGEITQSDLNLLQELSQKSKG